MGGPSTSSFVSLLVTDDLMIVMLLLMVRMAIDINHHLCQNLLLTCHKQILEQVTRATDQLSEFTRRRIYWPVVNQICHLILSSSTSHVSSLVYADYVPASFLSHDKSNNKLSRLLPAFPCRSFDDPGTPPSAEPLGSINAASARPQAPKDVERK